MLRIVVARPHCFYAIVPVFSSCVTPAAPAKNSVLECRQQGKANWTYPAWTSWIAALVHTAFLT